MFILGLVTGIAISVLIAVIESLYFSKHNNTILREAWDKVSKTTSEPIVVDEEFPEELDRRIKAMISD